MQDILSFPLKFLISFHAYLRYQWADHPDHCKDLFLLQNLSMDDANFGQRRWHQRWNKGQCLSRPFWPTQGSMIILKYMSVNRNASHKHDVYYKLCCQKLWFRNYFWINMTIKIMEWSITAMNILSNAYMLKC